MYNRAPVLPGAGDARHKDHKSLDTGSSVTRVWKMKGGVAGEKDTESKGRRI
ncbi:MAG: hypothetical protein GX989_01050 [Firmicutes bacterium]|jgi:hypothetical protein|nr:hypothetical protein [Bacillota bacterium]